MTKKETNQIILDFIRHNLSPTKREREFISTKYAELEDILRGDTFQNGSYARHTSTTPVNDLDVFYVISLNEYPDIAEAVAEHRDLDVSNILEDLAKVLREAYPQEVRIEVQPHSVGIFFGEDDEFSIDVVPAIPANDGMYWVPETSHFSVARRRKAYETSPSFHWIKSDPEGYRKDASEVDLNSDGNFRKTAKFIKKWKQRCKNNNTNFPLKSFHLELIITEFYKRNATLSCIDAVDKFYSTLEMYIRDPQFPDKADPERFIDEYLNGLSDEERNVIDEFRREAISIVQKIKRAETEAEVLNLVKEFLELTDSSNSGSSTTLVGPAIVTPRVSPAISKPYYWQ